MLIRIIGVISKCRSDVKGCWFIWLTLVYGVVRLIEILNIYLGSEEIYYVERLGEYTTPHRQKVVKVSI